MADNKKEEVTEMGEQKEESKEPPVDQEGRENGGQPKAEEGAVGPATAVEMQEEDSMTISEFLAEQEARDEQARALLGGQDDKVCTFPEGYKPRQALYSCLTCVPSGTAGICFGCSLHCHDGHKLVELFTKRRFACDCGSSSFPNKCSLYEEKPAKNERNKYNKNFLCQYCTCNRPFPDLADDACAEDMHQCIACEDWFHPSHIGLPSEVENEIICKECAIRVPFLSKVAVGHAIEATVTCTVETPAEENLDAPAILLINDWREKLCKCAKCEDLYDKYGLDWIHDVEDSMAKYEQDTLEKTKDEVGENGDSLVQELTRDHGPEVTLRLFTEMAKLKRKMGEFFASKNDSMITETDVKQFFDGVKKARLEEMERDREGRDQQ